MTDKQLEPCSMGVGCDEVGICYANAHGKPENCPKQRSEDVDLASRLFAFAGITPDCPHNPGFSHLNYFARELVLEAAKALRQPTQSDALREAVIEECANALEADAMKCDCAALEERECGCGAWSEWKSITSARAVEIVRELVDKP